MALPAPCSPSSSSSSCARRALMVLVVEATDRKATAGPRGLARSFQVLRPRRHWKAPSNGGGGARYSCDSSSPATALESPIRFQKEAPFRTYSHLANPSRTTALSSSIGSLRSISSSTPSQSTAEVLGPREEAPHDDVRGLFSIPELRNPQDFQRLVREAMEECDQRRRQQSDAVSSGVTSSSLSSSSDVLHQLDAISQAVCNVIDAAELCRSAHAQESWREAAHRAFGELSEYIATLNSDPVLYQALSSVVTDPARMATLTEEERRFAALLKAEFEREGIHIQDEQARQRLLEVRNATTDLESTFSRNLVGTTQRTFRAPLRSVRDVVPLAVLKHFVPSATEGDKNIDLPTDQALLQSLVKYSSDPKLRRDAYLESVTAVPENLAVLESLVARRGELASILGFGSYAEYSLVDKMAGHPSRVFQFLKRVAERNKASYQKEMALLLSAKKRVEGPSDSATMEPWDVPFYVGALKARGGFDIHAASEYLTLEQSVRGMQLLVQNLFGIEMTEVPMTSDERWDVTEARGTSMNKANRIQRFDVSEHGTSLGTMYLDLHPRPGKYGHAAHFTVRCGCLARKSPTATSRLQHASSEDVEDTYQKPIVALVCNFSASGREGVLAHGEFETLYHEFGHALHSLLSRTKFQHMSGTRAAMDFVETPSHLLENFAWDPQFLALVARHHGTGEAMPDNMIQHLVKSRHEFAAIERQNQIIYALFDQTLFGRRDGNKSVSSVELFESLHRTHGVPHAPGTHWHTRFGHLVTYGASYYGYLFSQVFAADIWKECFQRNSLSREAGDRLWHKLLRHGGAKDPWLMLEDMLGRPPMSVG